MANINLPSQNQPVWLPNDQTLISQGGIDPNWYIFNVQIRNWIIENSGHGTSAQRPTNNLYIGRTFRDDTLGYHVHIHSLSPTIWHNEAGATV